MASARKGKTVRQIVTAGLKKGLANSEILAKVLKAHPHSEIGLPTINYFRNQMRAADNRIPTETNARKRASSS